MDNDYTLEEIIAEVKNGNFVSPPEAAPPAGGAASSPVPDGAEGETFSSHVRQEEGRRRPSAGAPTRPEASRRVAPDPMDSGRHEEHPGPAEPPQISVTQEDKPRSERTSRGKIIEFERPQPAPVSQEEEAWEPERPRRRPRAPWRTAPPEEWEEEEQSGPVWEEEEAEPEPQKPFDFLSKPFDDAEQGAAFCASKGVSMAARILFLVPLALLSAYISLAPTLSLPMPFGFTYASQPFYTILVLCGMELLAMLLALQVIGFGLYRLVTLRPTLDSLVAFSCLCTLLHAAILLVQPQQGGGLPYCCISILVCLLAVAAKRQKADTLKRAYKICQLATAPIAVKRLRTGPKSFAAVKTQQGAYPDVEQIPAMSDGERIGGLYAPIAMVACLTLASVAAFGRGGDFWWSLAALASVSVPLPLLFASASPARRVAKKLFTSGAALLGGRAARRLARVRTAILRDGDLFPAGSVAITGMKVAHSQKAEECIAIAAAVFAHCGSGVAKAFADFARQQYIPVKTAQDLRFFETGGLSAMVDGHYVLAGRPSFLMRMGVRITAGNQLADGLFLAVDSNFAGVFTVKYAVQPQAFSSFRILLRCRIRPVLATLHFGLTQAVVEKRFELRSGWAEYPDMARRMELNDPDCGRGEAPLAILSRDSSMAFAEAAGGARQQCRAERAGVLIGLLSGAFGFFVMYFLTAAAEVPSASPYNVILFLLLWQIPFVLSNMLITKF